MIIENASCWLLQEEDREAHVGLEINAVGVTLDGS